MINKAITFATSVHGNQKRKGSNIPYILHPLEAGVIVSQTMFDEQLVAAAILHDILEETETSFLQLQDLFGSKVASLVQIQTHPSGTWREQREHTLHAIETNDLETKIVYLGDKLSNLRSIHRDYLIFGDGLWQRFTPKNKEPLSWYYHALVARLSPLEPYLTYQEFKNRVRQVFGS